MTPKEAQVLRVAATLLEREQSEDITPSVRHVLKRHNARDLRALASLADGLRPEAPPSMPWQAVAAQTVLKSLPATWPRVASLGIIVAGGVLAYVLK